MFCFEKAGDVVPRCYHFGSPKPTAWLIQPALGTSCHGKELLGLLPSPCSPSPSAHMALGRQFCSSGSTWDAVHLQRAVIWHLVPGQCGVRAWGGMGGPGLPLWRQPPPQAAGLPCHWVWVCVTLSVAFLGVQAVRNRLVPSSSFPQI